MTSLEGGSNSTNAHLYHLAYFLLVLFSMSQRASNGAVLKRILRLHGEALAVLEIYAEDDEGDELRSGKKRP